VNITIGPQTTDTRYTETPEPEGTPYDRKAVEVEVKIQQYVNRLSHIANAS
jgi:hypothetical protein